MKLSIVIALYNTEAYIEKCIRSVYVQNKLPFQDFEVIVVNDGSTDNSRVIVERLQLDYANLELVNKENGGQSTARNIGFDKAKGSYIFCLDSDDSVNAKEMVQALEYCKKEELDMLPVSYKRYNEINKPLKEKRDNYPVICHFITGGDFMNKFVISGAMWRYFYKTSIIKKYDLYLTEGIYHEDEEFIIKFLSYAKRIAYQKHQVYNHVVRSNSTVNNKNKHHRTKLLKDLLVVIKHLDNHRDKFNSASVEHLGISKKIEQLLVSVFLRMKKDKLKYKETRYFVRELKVMGLHPIRIKLLGVKFKLAAKMFNNTFFNKQYYR